MIGAWGGEAHDRIVRVTGLRACRIDAAVQASREGGSNSVVESQPSKLLVGFDPRLPLQRFSEGLAPLGLPQAGARAGWGPRSASADAPSAGFRTPGADARLGTGGLGV